MAVFNGMRPWLRESRLLRNEDNYGNPRVSQRFHGYRRFAAYVPEVKEERSRRSAITILAKFFLFCSAMILFCVLMYIPVYNKANVEVSKGSVAGWTVHTNRDTKLYVRPYNITVVHEPKNICARSPKNNLFLLIIVCSSIDNFERRASIRETWGSYTNYLELSKIYNKVKEKYKKYNYTYDLYPGSKESANTNIKVRQRRHVSSYVQLLPELAKALENNLDDLKTESVPEEEKRFEDDDPVLPEFDMNKELSDNVSDFDYDYETNVMKIPPKGYEDTLNWDKVLNLLKKKNFPKINQMNIIKYGSYDFSVGTTDVDFKLVFLLGLPTQNTSEVQRKIEEEIHTYGDIIQEDFIDSYSNLTLKSIMMLKWITNNCNDSVRYILKTDDDMYINIPNLVGNLRNRSQEFEARVANGYKGKEYLLIGDLICGARPVLDEGNKWFSPRYMYGGRVYPRYVSGTGYALSMPTAAALYNAALHIPYFHLEDVFVTGMCAAAARPRIRPRHEPGFSRGPLAPLSPPSLSHFPPSHSKAPCRAHAQLSAHRVPPTTMRQLTEALADPDLVDKCERMRLTQVRKDRLRPKIKLKRLTKFGLTMT